VAYDGHVLRTAATTPIEEELESYRRALTGYCYRMIGSGAEAEDAVQETMVRAWKASDKLEARGALKAWLFKIANNVCLDMLQSSQRRAIPMEMGPSSNADSPLGPMLADSAYVRPIADAKVLPEAADPAELAAERETLRLAFVAALQHLPAKQRAVLILREVLRWQASEVAELLDTSVASVNSALQRARATIEELQLDTSGPATVEQDQKELLAKYVKAFEAYDMTSLVALLKDDAAFSMPPWPLWLEGPEQIVAFMLSQAAKCEGSKLLPVQANGGPAVGLYNPTPEGDFAPWAIVVVETSGGLITGLHHFIYPELFAEFGLPPRLDGKDLVEADQLQQPA
jgi:RNA polymerase sigma-70 factor (ECF subfamily)